VAGQTSEEHAAWLDEQVPKEPLSRARSRFDSASGLALLEIESSVFWQTFMAQLPELDDAYFQSTGGFKLFAGAGRPGLVRKSFDSLLDKAYRKNVVHNVNWPEPPPNGWVTQENWYSRINDIIRTTMVVKYLDGVEYLASAASRLSAELSLPTTTDFEAREEGYYAAHLYVTHAVAIPRPSWDTELADIRLEIQVTTQLQDAIRQLTHAGYAQRRSRDASSQKWQWDHKHPDFSPNYLGHILHYVEGMIMEIRDRQETK
jgi:hypothetical protein